ncbi:hypothetical protein JCM3775_000372 [Rhodotorula graminis]
MNPATSTEADPSNLAIDTLKCSSSAHDDSHPVPRLTTPRKRGLVKVPHKRLSTASALAESLTTPPPPYETATRSSIPPPSPSARRSRTPRPRPPSAPAADDGDGDDSDPTSDSDDPLNHLLRLTGSLLSTSTSILASSTALHSSLSRLLSSDAVARPPHLVSADSRAELELRSGVDAADRAGDRLSQLESATERWARTSGGAQAGPSVGAGADRRTAREGPVVGRQDRAERPRTLYATATGAGSGFLAGLDEEGGEGEGAETSGSRFEQELSSPPVWGAPQPVRRSSSAAQDLLGRLAGREACGAEVEAGKRLDGAGVDEPPVEQAPPSVGSSGPRTALYSLVEEHGAAPSPSGGSSTSIPGSPLAGDAPTPRSASRPTSAPRTPTSRRRSAPFQMAAPSPATIASSLASPYPSSSTFFTPSPSRAGNIRASATLSPSLSSPASTLDGLGIASASASSSPSTSPSSSRPFQHRRTSTAAASATAFATSLSQYRAATTTSLAHDLDGEHDSLAAVVRAGAGAGAAGSARGALQALSASTGAAGAGGASGVPNAQVGKAEGRAATGRARAPSGDSEAQRVGASWWSWS